jgi:chromate transporter
VSESPSADAVPPGTVSFREALKVWVRVALQSFGGPAGQIAVMHRILVEEKRWISEPRFLNALNFCMLLPGPEAQQLAVYLGWRLHGTPGGVVAGTLFVLPGVVAILALSFLYVAARNLPAVDALFFGLKAAVLAIVVEALLRIGRRALGTGAHAILAAAAFAALFFFQAPFPVVVLGAGLVGLVMFRASPASDIPREAAAENEAASWKRQARLLLVCLALWFGPLLLIASTVGTPSVYLRLGAFFSKAAVVTFGGAYAILPYVAQEAVESERWLTAGEMLDGLGMAETTPGPLIMVLQFVGFLAAYRSPTPLSPAAGGLLGSFVTTWVTFVPSFLFVLLGAPYVERLGRQRAVAGALSAITAAVVGVVANLSIWFALHVLFARVEEHRSGALRLLSPDWSTISVPALAICAGALVATLLFKVSTGWTLLGGVAAGLMWRLVAGA